MKPTNGEKKLWNSFRKKGIKSLNDHVLITLTLPPIENELWRNLKHFRGVSFFFSFSFPKGQQHWAIINSENNQKLPETRREKREMRLIYTHLKNIGKY